MAPIGVSLSTSPGISLLNKSSVPDYLNRKCDLSHVHAPLSGQNTKGTGDYTPEIADAFHRCFKDDV
eukprot:537523-Heterocapsa_arctica.AAC.1